MAPPPRLPNRRTAIATAPPSASCSGGLQHRLVARGKPRRIERRQPAEQAERSPCRRGRARRARPRSSATARVEDRLGDRIALGGMVEHHRREAAEVAGLGGGGELDHVLADCCGTRRASRRSAARPGGCRHGRAASLPAGRGRCGRRCPGRRPGSPSRRWRAITPSRARHIGGAGAEDRHRAVAARRPHLRARSARRSRRGSGEGQDRFELLPVGADIAAGEAEHGRRFAGSGRGPGRRRRRPAAPPRRCWRARR